MTLGFHPRESHDPGASIPRGKTSEILDAEQAVESIAFHVMDVPGQQQRTELTVTRGPRTATCRPG